VKNSSLRGAEQRSNPDRNKTHQIFVVYCVLSGLLRQSLRSFLAKTPLKMGLENYFRVIQ